MNIKRLIAAGAAGAMILGAAVVPALADDDVTLKIKNWAWVKNITTTLANTGGNAIVADDDVDGGSILTGAATAGALVDNLVNTNDVDPCLCENDGDVLVKIKNWAKVKNTTTTTADTGNNVIAAGDDVEGGSIDSGDADATSLVTNAVNTNLVGI